MSAMKHRERDEPGEISRWWPLSRTVCTNARPSRISTAATSADADHDRGQRG